MKTSLTPRRGKSALWLTMGTTAASAVLMLSLSACTPAAPEKGTQPTPTATETIKSDYATATPSPTATPGSSSSAGSKTTVSPTLPAGTVNAAELPASVTDAEKQEMDKVTTDFIHAYGSIESTDAKPTQWRERAAAFTTPEFQKELEKTYPDNASASGWSDFKKNHAHQFAEISTVHVGVGKDYDKGKVVMNANYLLSLASDTSNGTQVLGRHWDSVTLTKVGSTWKVSAINPSTAGGM